LLDGLSSQDPFVRQRLVGGDQQEYDEALGRLRQVMTSEPYYRLLDALDDFVERAPLTELGRKPAARVIERSLLKQIKRMRKRVDAVQDAGGDDHGSADAAKYDAALHEVRKAARRLRYGVTSLAVPGGYRAPKKFRRIASAVKPVEKALGRHQDRVLFSEQVRISAQRARAEGEDTFLYGVLSEKTAEPGQDAASDKAGGAADTGDPVLHELDATLRSVEKLARKL
jgi:CHAD domain-containing protein